MKIVKLEAENVKRLKAVRITPEGKVVTISGPNGAGKTSVLDSIWMALGGKEACPPEPIRRGARQARVALVLDGADGLQVERRWTSNDRSYLDVRDREGLPLRAPQKILDDLVGKLSFDPLAFQRLAPAQQAEQLRKLAGIDFSALDARRTKTYDARTAGNRKVKELRARFDALPDLEAPDDFASAPELLEEQQRRQQQRGANDVARAGLQRAKDLFAARKRDLEVAAGDVERARQALAAAEERQRAAEAALEAARKAGLDLKEKLEHLVDPDLEEIPRRLRELDQVNEKVRAKKQRAQVASELEAAEATAKKLDEEIEAIDGQKAKALAEAKFPVEGLSFNETGVRLGGLPLEQASAAEQLRVSLAMAIALNPKLRVMLIRDGSLLDPKSLALVAEMAEANDCQVWIEMVAANATSGVVIEDGEVVGADVPAEAAHG